MSTDPLSEPPVMNDAAFYQITAQVEAWCDKVSTSDSPTQQAWRQGFAAGMQRMDIYSEPIRHPPTPGDPDAA